MANPLLAEFQQGRQVAQRQAPQLGAGQGIDPAQLMQYAQGNALQIGQRLDGANNNLVSVDPSSDVRARERNAEKIKGQGIIDANAMTRAQMELQGRERMADSQNALTKEMGYARIGSAEDMQGRDIEGNKEILKIQLTDKERGRVEEARQFDTRQAWMKEAKGMDLTELEKNRIYNAVENQKGRDATASENDKNRKLQKDLKKTDLQNAIALSGVTFGYDTALKKQDIDAADVRQDKAISADATKQDKAISADATKQDKTIKSTEKVATWDRDIQKARTSIMESEVDIKKTQVEGSLELSRKEIANKMAEWGERREIMQDQLAEDIRQADQNDRRALTQASLTYGASIYNIDKSFDLKMIERQDLQNAAANMQPTLNDMNTRVQNWANGGRTKYSTETEEACIVANANRIQGLEITSILSPDGNVDPAAFKQAKDLLYADPANDDVRSQMLQYKIAQINAMDTEMNKMETSFYTYKSKYPITTPPSAPAQSGNPLVPSQVQTPMPNIPGLTTTP